PRHLAGAGGTAPRHPASAGGTGGTAVPRAPVIPGERTRGTRGVRWIHSGVRASRTLTRRRIRMKNLLAPQPLEFAVTLNDEAKTPAERSAILADPGF